MDPSRLPHLRTMRQKLRRNLDQLEQQRADYGGLDVPLPLVNNISFQQQVLAQIEATIAILEPPPAPGAIELFPLPGDGELGELGQLLGHAIQELRQQHVITRQQTHATTLALAQRAVHIENDLARQLTAVHKAIAQVQEAGIISSTDTRALLEAKLGEVAAQVEAANVEREAWQERETRERREHQARRLWAQRGLAIAVILVCILFLWYLRTHP